MAPSALYANTKHLGPGGSMVARLKLKGIDGRAPPGVEPPAEFASTRESLPSPDVCGDVWLRTWANIPSRSHLRPTSPVAPPSTEAWGTSKRAGGALQLRPLFRTRTRRGLCWRRTLRFPVARTGRGCGKGGAPPATRVGRERQARAPGEARFAAPSTPPVFGAGLGVGWEPSRARARLPGRRPAHRAGQGACGCGALGATGHRHWKRLGRRAGRRRHRVGREAGGKGPGPGRPDRLGTRETSLCARNPGLKHRLWPQPGRNSERSPLRARHGECAT